MRVRLLGHHIPLSMAMLAILESAAVFWRLDRRKIPTLPLEP